MLIYIYIYIYVCACVYAQTVNVNEGVSIQEIHAGQSQNSGAAPQPATVANSVQDRERRPSLPLLLHVRRQIPPGVILVDKGAVDGRHRLQDVLQRFAQVVAVAEAHALVEHDVDFDVELVAGVVGLQPLDLLDGAREAHREVQEHVALVGRGGGAREVADVPGGGAGPVYDDVEGEEEAPERV